MENKERLKLADKCQRRISENRPFNSLKTVGKKIDKELSKS